MSNRVPRHPRIAVVADPARVPPAAATTPALPRLPARSTEHIRAWMHDGLQDLPHDSAILALGCEEVFLAPQLTEYSSDVTVLDTSGGQLTQLARRFPDIAFLQHTPGNPLPFAHDTFDAVWCCEFLDRVFDPLNALREMHRVLAPGGRLMVTVPDHGTVRNVLIALFKWDEHFSPTNPRIRHFTRRTLMKLARKAGFEDVTTVRGGSVRRIAGSLVPRSLLLQARKAPGVRPALVAARDRRDDVELGEDLAFASRTRAA